jgi:hypothetical protein
MNQWNRAPKDFPMTTSLLPGSFYAPGRGGHAPGDVRDAFAEAVDAYEAWDDGDPEPTVELRDQQFPIRVIFGLLWNCSDILPSSIWETARSVGVDDDVKSRTYGVLARALKPLAEHHAALAKGC